MEVIHYIAHILVIFYSWPNGFVWGNVLVIPVAGVLAYAWAKTKFFPLRPIQHGISKLHDKVDSVHAKLDHHKEQQQLMMTSLNELHKKNDSLAASHQALLEQAQGHHDTLLTEVQALKDHVNRLSPSELYTDQTPEDQS
jgi:hypothetical protein